jgi:hypothetical protein
VGEWGTTGRTGKKEQLYQLDCFSLRSKNLFATKYLPVLPKVSSDYKVKALRQEFRRDKEERKERFSLRQAGLREQVKGKRDVACGSE